MSGYISNFLEDTIKEINSIKINGVPCTEEDVISVEVGDNIVTWECFKQSAKEITWDSDWGALDVRQDIRINLKDVILYLEEYDSALIWQSVLKTSGEPDQSITHINLRPTGYNEEE